MRLRRDILIFPCVLFKNLFQNIFPEPIAILDCVIFQPVPKASDSGLRKVSILSFDTLLIKIYMILESKPAML